MHTYKVDNNYIIMCTYIHCHVSGYPHMYDMYSYMFGTYQQPLNKLGSQGKLVRQLKSAANEVHLASED